MGRGLGLIKRKRTKPEGMLGTQEPGVYLLAVTMKSKHDSPAQNQPQMVATTMAGLENVLAHELEQIGAKNITVHTRAVRFSGDKALMYAANLRLRTALRVLKPIHGFRATDADSLYRGVGQMNWDQRLDVDATLAVESAVRSDYFRHSQFVSLRVKDAIVDQFRSRFGRRPSVDVDNPGLLIYIHVYDDHCQLFLDSSGSSLHLRGYRLEKGEAPLNEVLAAGMIQLTGWKGERPFLDPMCGSGTLVIEAAMIATGTPPQLGRRNFGFMNWRDYDPKLWAKIEQEARAQIHAPAGELIGSDLSAKNISIARSNAERAGVQAFVQFKVQAFEDLAPPWPGGLIIMNPPYGLRLKQENLNEFYGAIGDRLKKGFTGYDAWILSGSKEALKSVGLHTSKKISLHNGPVECKFQKYSIYAGTHKIKKLGQSGLTPSASADMESGKGTKEI